MCSQNYEIILEQRKEKGTFWGDFFGGSAFFYYICTHVFIWDYSLNITTNMKQNINHIVIALALLLAGNISTHAATYYGFSLGGG